MDERDYKAINEELKPQLKQTAVEWLVEEIEKHYIINNGSLNPTNVMELKRQAKQMEKEQMFEYIKNMYCNGDVSIKFHLEEFVQYYNKTYI